MYMNMYIYIYIYTIQIYIYVCIHSFDLKDLRLNNTLTNEQMQYDNVQNF